MKEVSIPRVSIKGRWIVVAICFPLIVTGIYLILPGTFVSSGMDRENILNTVSAGVVFNSLAAGIVEEMVFRGIIRNLLAKRWNTTISIVLPSVLFAAVHLIGQSFNPVSSILVLIGGTLVGCMFSVIAIDSDSIWNSAIVHVLWNAVILGFGFYIGGSANNDAIMSYVLETKSLLLTGGQFGVETAVIAIVGYCVVAFLAILWRKKQKV